MFKANPTSALSLLRKAHCFGIEYLPRLEYREALILVSTYKALKMRGITSTGYLNCDVHMAYCDTDVRLIVDDLVFMGGFGDRNSPHHPLAPFLKKLSEMSILETASLRIAILRYWHAAMGCQSSFFMCSTMGIFPASGQDLYWLSGPMFSEIEIHPRGSDAVIRLDAPGTSPERPYVSRLFLNGKALDRAWLRHKEIAHGAHLEFEMTSSPGDWGTRNLPPAF